MKMSRIVGWAGVLLGLAGCGTTPSSIIQQPTTARPQALPAQSAGNGAIYQPASYTPLPTRPCSKTGARAMSATC